jgi:hypothetical protein
VKNLGALQRRRIDFVMAKIADSLPIEFSDGIPQGEQGLTGGIDANPEAGGIQIK